MEWNGTEKMREIQALRVENDGRMDGWMDGSMFNEQNTQREKG